MLNVDKVCQVRVKNRNFGFHPNMTGAQLGGGGKQQPRLPFLENRKRCTNFGKQGPDCVHHWVKCFIQNVVLTVSRIKNSKKNFRIFMKCFSKSHSSMKPPMP